MKSPMILKNIADVFPSELHLAKADYWKPLVSNLRNTSSPQKIRMSLLLFLHLCIVLLFIFLLTLMITLPVFTANHEDVLNMPTMYSREYSEPVL